ncbi:MAPEG family protein [Mesorhizobium sp. VK24D]|uniref:MAPEG family protein n=1 Tax=Mesorhizobium album TaxID=3072314 RepID=A0ABU4XVG9_9HYPH|nr:MAPEG family protein [Mesorhizobium sp. VK24D]MDX8477890.1 MAPEG family protein [Mesorhizobium sp. VK24D]
MSFELAMLAASCVLCFIHIVLASHSASFQRGYRWTASARDTEVPPLTGMAGRLERAQRNFVETFPVFVAAVFLVHAVGHETVLSKWGAGLYFSARLVYLPLYAFGVPLLRSLVWNVAFVGMVMLLLASVWPDLPLLGNS